MTTRAHRSNSFYAQFMATVFRANRELRTFEEIVDEIRDDRVERVQHLERRFREHI